MVMMVSRAERVWIQEVTDRYEQVHRARHLP